MKKNIFLFAPDSNLSADINSLITFISQPLPLNEFFEKIPGDILNEKLAALEFEFENIKHAEHFFVKFKTNNRINKVELTNKDISPFGLTITDKNQLVLPLFDAKKETPESSLKDQLKTLIKTAHNINKKLILDATILLIKNKTLKLPDNKNKQREINIFFSFLKKLITQKNNNYPEYGLRSEPLLELAHNKLINWQFSNLINWFISENKFSVLGPFAIFPKKYNEIDNLIDKLSPFNDTAGLVIQLKNLNNGCLQNLLNINSSEDRILEKRKAIEIVQKFQTQTTKVIKEFQKNNPLSLEQLSILYKILNAIAKLIPRFIVQKKTRVCFFQQYTPQKEILLKIEKTILPCTV